MAKNKWKTDIGKDCINLNMSLCKWLGERLAFLAEHNMSIPIGYGDDRYKADLTKYSKALLAYNERSEEFEDESLLILNAKDALHWTAMMLPTLWD